MLFWSRMDRHVAQRLYDLIEAITTDPFRGIGKPEPLKGDLAGSWSRRLTEADRVVYRVFSNRIEFLQARYHY
jgi:toxin YoeB